MKSALLLLLAVQPAFAGKPKKAPAVAASTQTASGLPVLAPSTAPLTVEVVISRLEELEAKMTGLSAHFVQMAKLDAAGTASRVEGDVDYLKSDRLRIEHAKPERQTVVSDGKTLWVWRHENNQVIETSLAEWKKSEPIAEGLMDFGGYSNLLKRYDVRIATVSAPGADGHRTLSLLLQPKEKGADFGLVLTMSTRDFFPAEAELKTAGVWVQSRFERIRFNPAFPDGRFKFTPPPGADVFNDFKPPRK